jgi:hypothetical protein
MQFSLARASLISAFGVALACSSTSKNTLQPAPEGGAADSGIGGAGNSGQGGASGRATGGTAGSGGAGATGGSAGEDSGSSGVGGASGSSGSGGTGGASATGGAGGTGGASGRGGSGGTGGAGGRGGSGGTGGVDAGPPPACRNIPGLATTLFCDSFDQSDLLRQWTHFAPGFTDGRSLWAASPAHSVPGSLNSTKSAQGPADPLYADALGGLSSGRLYLRVWLYIPNYTQIDQPTGNASLLVLGESAPGNFRGVSFVLWQTGFSLQINPPGPQPAKFNLAVPRDQWFCVQIDFPIASNAMKSQFHLRIDAQQIVNIEPEASVSTALPFSRVMVGVNYITPNQVDPVTLQYDDLVVDTRDIACTP